MKFKTVVDVERAKRIAIESINRETTGALRDAAVDVSVAIQSAHPEKQRRAERIATLTAELF